MACPYQPSFSPCGQSRRSVAWQLSACTLQRPHLPHDTAIASQRRQCSHTLSRPSSSVCAARARYWCVDALPARGQSHAGGAGGWAVVMAAVSSQLRAASAGAPHRPPLLAAPGPIKQRAPCSGSVSRRSLGAAGTPRSRSMDSLHLRAHNKQREQSSNVAEEEVREWPAWKGQSKVAVKGI